MMRLILLLLCLEGSVAWAAATIKAQFPLSVYGQPNFESPVLFTVERGASVMVSDKPHGAFRKIKVRVLGVWRLGYVPANDLKAQKVPPRVRTRAVGGGIAYTRLTQGAKKFSTADEVTYNISGYSGQTVSPLLIYQSGRENFWRAYGMYRRVSLTGTAKTDIANASAQDIEIDYTMLALGGEMAWTLISHFGYLGVGGEFAKSLSGKVMFGKQDLSGDTEMPDYFTLYGLTGVQFQFGSAWSVVAQLKLGVIANQEPTLTMVEVITGLLYWL